VGLLAATLGESTHKIGYRAQLRFRINDRDIKLMENIAKYLGI